MKHIAMQFFDRDDEPQPVSISARLSGKAALFWDYLAEVVGDTVRASELIRDAIRLLAFAAMQTQDNRTLSTVIVNPEGKEERIDDIVGFLKLAIANSPEPTHSVGARPEAAGMRSAEGT